MDAVRNTKQKALIFGLLEGSESGHITVEDICEILRRNNTPVAKSTVYRYLTQLEAEGIVRKYPLAEGMSACYQFIGKACRDHYHLMCRKCGSIAHFEHPGLESLFEAIKKEQRIQIDGHRTVFYGLCRECAEA